MREQAMQPLSVVTCFPLDRSQVRELRDFSGPDFRWTISGQSEIARDILEADVFCGHAKERQIDWSAVVAKGRLKWIQSTAAGLDHCLHSSVVESDIRVTGCSALFAKQVGEQVSALLFSLIRSVPTFLAAQRERSFVRQPTDTLFNKTMGIVGFGGNGQRIARIFREQCKRIVATDCFPESCPEGLADVFPAGELLRLFSESDIVVVTLPLAGDNEGLIGSDCFSAMKKPGYFVNVGRGAVVDQDALVSALESGRLMGAGLDVVEPEPLPPESRLWAMDNVVISPHVGAQSAERVSDTIELICENLRRFQLGDPMCNLVDKRLGFPLPKDRLKWNEWGRP